MAKKKPVKIAVQPVIIKELELAWKRINGSSARRLRWLLSFSEMDLDFISQGKMEDLRWELVAFGLGKKPPLARFEIAQELLLLTMGPLPTPPSAGKQRGTVVTTVFWPTTDKPKSKRAKDLLERAKDLSEWLFEMQKGMHPGLMHEFQATLRTAFNVLFAGEKWIVRRPSAEVGIRLTQIQPQAGNLSTESLQGHDMLLLQAIDLIEAEFARLLICENPKCKKRFVAEKVGRARFHSAQCSAYVRVNKARGKM